MSGGFLCGGGVRFGLVLGRAGGFRGGFGDGGRLGGFGGFFLRPGFGLLAGFLEGEEVFDFLVAATDEAVFLELEIVEVLFVVDADLQFEGGCVDGGSGVRAVWC